jgi:hypothetical protein
MLGEHLRPRLYVEPVGQGDSDNPRHYRYSTGRSRAPASACPAPRSWPSPAAT